jgi:rhodanese-related sulfurtransferase
MSAATVSAELRRLPRREHAHRLPLALHDQPGLVVVDTTWGTIQPVTVAPGVQLIGELEVTAHLRDGGQLIDTRAEELGGRATIPGAIAIAHTDIVGHLGELDPERPVALFCNGPQCAATPDAVRRLLAAGRPPGLILYYRGGMHDWITLGLPTTEP